MKKQVKIGLGAAALALAAALLLLGGLFLSPALGLHAQAEEISSTQKLRVGYYAYTC